MDVLMIVGIIL